MTWIYSLALVSVLRYIISGILGSFYLSIQIFSIVFLVLKTIIEEWCLITKVDHRFKYIVSFAIIGWTSKYIASKINPKKCSLKHRSLALTLNAVDCCFVYLARARTDNIVAMLGFILVQKFEHHWHGFFGVVCV